jgi:putative addiction module component (TIGR02574 family)
MTEPRRSLESQALALPADQRERLAKRLPRSVDREPLTDTDRAWIDEAERRYEQFKSGQVQGVPADEVTDRVRRELGWNE